MDITNKRHFWYRIAGKFSNLISRYKTHLRLHHGKTHYCKPTPLVNMMRAMIPVYQRYHWMHIS